MGRHILGTLVLVWYHCLQDVNKQCYHINKHGVLCNRFRGDGGIKTTPPTFRRKYLRRTNRFLLPFRSKDFMLTRWDFILDTDLKIHLIEVCIAYCNTENFSINDAMCMQRFFPVCVLYVQLIARA